MSKYHTLLNILDRLRSETTTLHTAKYNPPPEDVEGTNQARARAFIHLYLKVSFGILDFNSREYFVTDGTNDGGIDGYYINADNKTIYFLQSKFRTTEKNFESKKIQLEEILVMDINRILEGEENDENGNTYNGKIKQLIRDIRKIDDIARYKYQVVLLANLDGVSQTKLRYLSGGYPIQVIDYENCYEKLVFPVISGTYFNATDLNIFIDLSNKNAGSKISYTVQTKSSQCEITVLFVPTLEVAKILYKYKNSILKFNPRSYLDFEGQKVNNAIRETILKSSTNEFALYNNGITMLSDETYINEKIGQKNKAQLTVKNPQIINGGQTSFTLSRILEENIDADFEKIFEGKEVLLKIITLIDTNGASSSHSQKLQLIDDISTATNQQTPVITADRFSNEHIHIGLQKILFERYGVLYERKRGEFGDGIFNHYVKQDQVIERNLFFRLYYAANGNLNKSVEKKLFLKQDFTEETLMELDKLDNFYFAYLCFKKLFKAKNNFQKIEKNIYGQVFVMTLKYKPSKPADYWPVINEKITAFKIEWEAFIKQVSLISKNHKRTYIDKETQKPISFFSETKWYRSSLFETDVINYFVHNGKIEEHEVTIEDKFNKLRDIQKNDLSKERAEMNYQKNKERLLRAEDFISKLKAQIAELDEKINASPSEKHQQILLKWKSEKNDKIIEMEYAVERYKIWVQEDIEKLANFVDAPK